MASVTAVMLVRNEQNVLPCSVAHLLYDVRVDRLIIADNESSDATPAILRRLAALDERVQWTHAPGPYAQSELVTGLAREAARQGAEWILPSDADEFFWFGGRPFGDLQWRSGVAGAKLKVRNFVQRSWMLWDHPRALEWMTFSAEPDADATRRRERVESGEIAFIEIAYPYKLVRRAAPDMTVAKGNHGVGGVEGKVIALPDCEILHAPLRAWTGLRKRIAVAERLSETAPPGESWHLRRLTALDRPALRREWLANSTWSGSIGPGKSKRPLLRDPRLREIALRHRRFIDRLARGSSAS